MKRKRITVLGGLALGCSLLALAPAIAGADDPVLSTPSTDTPAVDASPADFLASLSGGQEVPGNASPAFGVAEFRLSEDGTAMSYSARAFGLADPTAAHLHIGPLGASGPIVVALKAPGAPGTSGCVAVVGGGLTTLGGSSADGDDHSSVTDPGTGGGGCTEVVPDACRALLFPPLVAPTPPPSAPGSSTSTSTPSSSTPTSTASSTPSSTLTSESTSSTTADGSSTTLLEPVDHSSDDTVEPPTTGETSPSASAGMCGFADVSGVITASDLSGQLAGKTLADLVAAIRAGTIYINFHTTAFPPGEIRGQLIPQNPLAPTTPSTAATSSTTAATSSTTTTGASTSSTASGGSE